MNHLGFLKFLVAFFLVVILLCAAWATFGSRFFMNPVSLTLEDHKLTLVRQTPFGDQWVDWHGQVILLENRDNFECNGGGTTIIQQQPNDVITTRIGDWAEACLRAGPPFILRYDYQVWLFGLIPLRPVAIWTNVQRPTPKVTNEPATDPVLNP